MKKGQQFQWCRLRGLNPRPSVYKTAPVTPISGAQSSSKQLFLLDEVTARLAGEDGQSGALLRSYQPQNQDHLFFPRSRQVRA